MATGKTHKANRAEARKAKEQKKLSEALNRSTGAPKYRDAVRSGVNELGREWGISLSPIRRMSPAALRANPRNKYPEYLPEQMEDLIEDIRAKSMLEPLIARPDGVLVDGHNRLEAARRLNLESVPVLVILKPDPLPEDLELDIMTSANDRRRGGKWVHEQQIKFILAAGGDEIYAERRGGDRVSAGSEATRTASGGSGPLAKRIAEASRGMMSERTVERRLADIQAGRAPESSVLPRPPKKRPERELESLTPDERSRADALVQEIKEREKEASELRQQAASAQTTARTKRGELARIAPPHLFGL